MTYYLYELINKTTNTKYIGQTNDPERRKKEHMSKSHNSNIRKDVKKYGEEVFEFSIIDSTEDPIAINWMEINAIEHASIWNTNYKLYNKKSGGQLINEVDYYKCDCCKEIKGMSKISQAGGILLFRTSESSKNIEEVLILCPDCHIDKNGNPNYLCTNFKRFPCFFNLHATALMDLVINYSIPENILNRLIIVKGKINPQMAYAYFSKRLDKK